MTDVRALLAAERGARRITHPLLTYSKSGLLQCTACQLNIRSESLWEGHLRSPNHKKNAQAAGDRVPPASKKRKLDDDGRDAGGDTDPRSEETRKKSKAVQFLHEREDFVAPAPPAEDDAQSTGPPSVPDAVVPVVTNGASLAGTLAPDASTMPSTAADPAPAPPSTAPAVDVDEDEWAAFERDLAPLTMDPPPGQPAGSTKPTFSEATISAPARSAAEIAAEQATRPARRDRDADMQDEQEEEELRMQDEFAVMEEMEERVRRLRAKREAIRAGVPSVPATGTRDTPPEGVALAEFHPEPAERTAARQPDEPGAEDDEDEWDDWFS